MSSPPLISCTSLSKTYGPQTLFRNISLGFFQEERLGLIGPNGSGKSTFLKILANIEEPTDGKLSKKRNLKLTHLPQEDQLATELSILDTLFEHNPAQSAEWAQERDTRELIVSMGFEDLEQKVGTLSGGWRKRVAITRALLQKPELLLMDEPTNHLDLEGILWLESKLKRPDFAFVLVSHDRMFLENICNRIIELNPRYKQGYLKTEGNYSSFLEKREEQLNAQSRQEQSLGSKVRREIVWLKRGPKARTTKAQFRINQAHELKSELQELKTRNTTSQSADIHFSASGRKTKKLVEAKNISMQLGNKMLFQNLSFELGPGSCLGLLGPNGCGKSTLIHLLAGKHKNTSGSLRIADGLKIVTFDQERAQLDQTERVKNVLVPDGGDQVIYQDRPIHIVSWAKRFLFTQQQLGLPVSKLSGGEQARLLIAKLMLEPADLLLLDEPTNDLDIQTLEILEDRLENFAGALVLITHDRFLLNRLSDRLLAIDGKGQANFYADLEQWENAKRQTGKSRKSEKKAANNRKESPKKTGLKLTYEERKELQRIEGKIEKASAKVEDFQKQLGDPTIQSDAEKLISLGETLKKAEEKVDTLYARWEELEKRNKM